MTRSRTSIGFILVSCAALVGYLSVPPDGRAFFLPVIGMAAILCVLFSVHIHRPAAPGVWYTLVLGFSLLVLGDVILSQRAFAFPSIIDAFYLGGNLAIVAACVLMIRARSQYRDLGSFIDAAIVATTATFLAWKFLMQPLANDPSLTTLQKAVSLAYPAVTTLVLVVGVRLVLTRGNRAPSFFLILAAIASSLTGDVVYAQLILLGEFYPGHPMDLAYVLWFIFWAAAALHPSMTSVTAGSDIPAFRTSNRRMVFLVAAVLLVPAITIVRWALDDSVTVPLFVSFSTVLFLLVLWRMRDSVRLAENAFVDRQLVVDRERALHDVSSGLAVSSTRAEAFDAVTASLQSIATDHVSAHIALIKGEIGTIVSSGGTSATPMRGQDIPITALHAQQAVHRDENVRSSEIIHSLRHWLERSNPGMHHELHVLNPEGDATIVLILTGQRVAHMATADLLKGVGVQLIQALERIHLAEDISRRKNQEVFHSLVRNSSDVTMIIEENGIIRYVSPAAHVALGFAPDDLVGASLRDVIHPDDVPGAEAFMANVFSEPGVAQTTEFRVKNAQDGWHDVETVANNLLHDPDVGGIVFNVHDISVRKRSEALLEYQAFHDALTSLPNRALFLDRLSQMMTWAASHGEQVPVLFIDLDRFKFINDSLGHDGGDALLIMASQRIQRCLDTGETVARLGGDEFTVILSSSDNAERPSEVAALLVRTLSEPFGIKDRELAVTVSIGVALSGPHHEHGEELLREADIAMYQAKAQGRNGFVVFDAEMGLSVEKRVQLEQDLRRALGNDEFVLHYQPEVDLKSGQISSFEALIRWRHPEQGLLYPVEFISLAEETGLIMEIGRWAVREACCQAQRWRDCLPSQECGMSVNLSARQLMDAGLADDIQASLRSSGLPASLLRLEITETILMRDMEVSLSMLNALRMLGVQLAIDDFGNGYSSLGYLRYFPVDALKLDRSFLSDSTRPEQDDAIIQAVTTLAHSLEIAVTVEGIETDDQLARVRALGCDRGQGYFFSCPREAARIPELFERDALNQPVLQAHPGSA